MIEPFEATIHRLASRWSDAGALLPAFPLLALGRPVPVEEIADASGASPEQVSKALDSGRCARDSRGRVIDLWGMSLAPSPHRLEIEGRSLYSCCALWAHVIPKLINSTVRVESVDPQTRQVVRISISPDGVDSAEPVAGAATLAIAEQADIDSDVSRAFCSQVGHFVSKGSAEAFARGSATRRAVGLSELGEAADLLYESIWSAAV